MCKAILTIDDAPTKITPSIIDYLGSKGITPVINFMGCLVEENFSEAVYAAKSGIVIGNHSFSHPSFEELTLDECREEIRRAEAEIDRVYSAAGMKREYRVFRFPYGNKGGKNEAAIQKILHDEFCFDRLDSSAVTFPIWKKYHLDTDTSMHWSFDFLEYQLSWNNGFTWESVLERIHDKSPKEGAALLGKGAVNVVLMHDMESTENFMPRYYEKLIDYVLSCGVEFIKPTFIRA